MSTAKTALVLAQQLSDTKDTIIQFDQLAATLRALSDENDALRDEARDRQRLLDAASAEADSMGDLLTDLTGRYLRISLALRQDGEARTSLLKAARRE